MPDTSAEERLSRGVQLVLLDDGGPAVLHPIVVHRIQAALAGVLTRATGDVVNARIVPPRCPTLASILVSGPLEEHRNELDGDGYALAASNA